MSRFLELLIPQANAEQPFGSFTVTTWGYGTVTWQSILASIINMLTGTVTIAAVAVFVVGAFLFSLSGAQENLKSTGKNLMIGSLIGLGIVLGAQAILRTVSFFVWG